MAILGLGRKVAVWGDGFVDDHWSDMAGVSGWGQCSVDEYTRLFPRLIPADGCVAEPIQNRLAECIAVRGRRLCRQLGPSFRPSLRSVALRPLSEAGLHSSGSFFAEPGPLHRWATGLFGQAPDPGQAAQDNQALMFLDDILFSIQTGTLAEADANATAAFAFLTGIHPAYVWPKALLSHERDTTAGWLGHLGRGRPALMPFDVADHLLDILTCRDGLPATVRDSQIANYIAVSAELRALWRVACGRRRGRSDVVYPAFVSPLRNRAVARWQPGWVGQGVAG